MAVMIRAFGRAARAPACFDESDVEGWQPNDGDPCAVCPLSFSLAMRAEDGCDGEPGGDRDDDDEREPALAAAASAAQPRA